MEQEFFHSAVDLGKFLIASASMVLATELLSKPISWASMHIQDPIDRITASRFGASAILALVSIFSLKLSGIDETGYLSNGVTLGLAHPFISTLIDYKAERNFK